MNLAKFMSWASDNFNVLEFFEIFELIENPIKERQVIRELLKPNSEGG